VVHQLDPWFVEIAFLNFNFGLQSLKLSFLKEYP
jgi:hypothetical protein